MKFTSGPYGSRKRNSFCFFVVVGFKVEVVLEQLEGLKEGYRNNRSGADKPVIPDFGFL